MSASIDYMKRKNKELFKQFESNAYISLSNAQNYVPIYKKYFELNETNYNNINLNHKWHLSRVDASINNTKCFQCTLSDDEHKKTKNVFFKMAPLLDPYKYMSGKYDISESLIRVPSFSPNDGVHPKIMDPNNSSYVDSFFYYLSNRLLEQGFVHGIEYYGSFTGIKNNFTCNIIDDIEFLVESDFFNKNRGILFNTQEYAHLLYDENDSVKKRQQPLKIGDETISLEVEELDGVVPFGELTVHNLKEVVEGVSSSEYVVPLEDNEIYNRRDHKGTLVPLEEFDPCVFQNENSTTICSSTSSCSSRTSHTNSNDSVSSADDDDHDEIDLGIEEIENTTNNSDETTVYEDISDSDDGSSIYEEDEILEAVIPKFPVQMIAIEHCHNTLDHLIRTNKLTSEEMFSSFMQIVMILLAYQKTYSMTHNDLHTNNIMFIPTDKKHLYYCVNNIYYKVPTFGRIYKIIDFGRAIYKFRDVLFCSDSFQMGGDAATQYNTEPYMNDKKPRLDPNYSFDLCRLACSMFDYFIRDMGEVKEKCENEAFIRIIVEWCLDDNGINVLYKNSGAERYPEFKLYKMIARHVHKHTPQAQLERPELAKYQIQKQNIKRGENIMNLDNLC
jgi:hypothetical protein